MEIASSGPASYMIYKVILSTSILLYELVVDPQAEGISWKPCVDDKLIVNSFSLATCRK
jgi:hypothetical protein